MNFQLIDLSYLLVLLAPVLRTLNDYDTIEIQKRSVNYLEANLMTAIVLVVQTAVIQVIRGEHGMVQYFALLFVSLCTYWLYFDFLLNKVRGKDTFRYYGDFNDEENLSFIEKHVYARVSWKVLLVLKLVFFVLSVKIYERVESWV